MFGSTRKIIGVIGLGIIGRAVSANLRQKGFQVFVWNRTPRPVPNFVGSPAELAELCDFLQVFVSDDEALLATVQRLSAKLGSRHIVIAHSTVAPDSMRAAAKIVERRSARFVEAPFTGSKIAAEKGELVYYVGGSDAALRDARPVLEASGKQITKIGEIGQATAVKIATNMVTAASVQAAAEALALVRALGLPFDRFVEAMQDNASYSATLAMKVPKMVEHNFEPHFSVKHMLKDMKIANQLGVSHNLDLGVTAAARDQLFDQMQWGHGDDDFFSWFGRAEAQAGEWRQCNCRCCGVDFAKQRAKRKSATASRLSQPAIAPWSATTKAACIQRRMMVSLPTCDAAFFDFSGRTKLRITGSDRVRFLNGQITNDVRKATESTAIEACVLNAKGKMNAHLFLSAASDCFWIDADPDLREALHARLERYVIADDVQIEDVTDRLSIFHVLSRAEPDVADCQRMQSARRFVETGWDIWADSALHDAVSGQLSSTFRFFDAAAAEILRIEGGIPRWGRELTEEIIPIEANLEERTVDYEKGCYIGQEVISRIKMSGQTNKRLCGLISLDGVPLQAGMRLASTPEKGKQVGWITSATRSEKIGKEIALGYVKRGFNKPGGKLDALEPENSGAVGAIPVEVVPLPFR